jgi:hypothetical protein
MSTLGDAVDVNPIIKFLPHTLQHLAGEPGKKRRVIVRRAPNPMTGKISIEVEHESQNGSVAGLRLV